MKKNYQVTTCIVIICIAFLNTSKAQTFNPFLAAKLDSTLIAGVPQQVKGVSASVYVPGQGIWRGTYGFSYTAHPITPDMEFGVASNTKLFTAAAIMKLIEANKITLNDHIGKWIKKKYNNIDSTISIKQLLNHTSGLSDNSIEFFDSATKFPSRVFTVDEILGWQDAKFASPSANKFNYSNTNYMLLGLIAENATGFHISKLIRDSILNRIHLDSTFFSYQEPVLGTIAHPWVSGIDKADTPRTGLNSASGAAGAIYSTASDMVKWYNSLFTGQVVNSNSLSQMTTFTGTGNYGFALEKRIVIGKTTWGHGGKTLGYLSEMFYDPITKVTACGISNSDSASVAATAFLLLKTITDNLPDTAKNISGLSTVCQGQNNVTYTVPAISKATSYTWTLPNGSVVNTPTNSIIINYDSNATSGYISVSGTNLYGNGVITTLSIIVKTKPSSNVIISGPTNFCSGNSVMLTANAAYSYIWSNGATTQSIVVTTAADYFVTITGFNNCTTITTPITIMVTANATPTVSIQSNAGSTICTGTNVVFTATANNGGNAPSYQWKKNGINVGTNSNSYSDTSIGNNDSVWCVLTSNSQCVISNNATSNKIGFIVNPTPAKPTHINGNTIGCILGGFNNLSSATHGGSWSSSDTSVATVNNQGKVYAMANGNTNITYQISNLFGCSAATSVTYTVAIVSVNPINGLSNICIGTSVQLSNTTPNGVWESLNNRCIVNSNTGWVTGSNAGTGIIHYSVTNAYGCKAVANANIIVGAIPNIPSIAYAPGTINPQIGAPAGNYCAGKTFTVVGTPTGGSWSATGVASITNAGFVTINAVGNGAIKYTYTNSNGCSSNRIISGNGFSCAARSIGSNNEQVTIKNEFTIFPNPTKGVTNLKIEQLNTSGIIIVTDYLGNTIQQQSLSIGINIIDVTKFSKGVYFVSLINKEGINTKKLIVQ